VHIDVSKRKKLQDKAWKGTFMGYAFDSPAWLIYNPITRKVIRSRNVVFNELWRPTVPSAVSYDTDSTESLAQLARDAAILDQADEPDQEPLPQSSTPTSRFDQLELERIVRIAEAPRTRSERAHQAQLDQASTSAASEEEIALPAVTEPASYRRAMSGPESTQWQLAARTEIDSHASNGTWDLVPYRPTMRVIGSMWKFKLKRDSSGNVYKFKARLVARGDMQDPDWGSVFAPTVRYTSLRVILAIACHQDLEIEQMDVVTTFLNAEVE